jgi:uncharacterized lipoprotein YddW (UPF0748 family)
VIFPVFFNAELLNRSPELYAITAEGEPAREEWVEFICPSREQYRQQVLEHSREVIHRYDPDGISIDFIRHFVFWEKVYPDRDPATLPVTCFDDTCLTRFQFSAGLRIPDSLVVVEEKARWMLENHDAEWAWWRCSLITSMVQEIADAARSVKPDVQVNIHLVPWGEEDFNGAIHKVAGQDVTALSGIVDYLSPMTYAHMVKRDPAWIHRIVEELHQATGGPVIPSIQVNRAYLETKLTPEEFEQSIREAVKPPSAGVVFWSWEQLESSPEKQELLKDIL